MFRKKAPFVPDPIFNKKKSEFIPCPLFTKKPDREYRPLKVKDITGEVNEQCNKVSD